MKRFRFPFEGLLKVRREAEKTAQRTVAGIHARGRQLEADLRRLHERLVRSRESLRAAMTGRIDVTTLRLQAATAIRIRGHADKLVLALAAVHKELEGAQRTLTAKARHRRAIERLREKRFAAWKADIEKAEQNELDDMAVVAAWKGRL